MYKHVVSTTQNCTGFHKTPPKKTQSRNELQLELNKWQRVMTTADNVSVAKIWPQN